jgi:hypothetical protein
VWGGEQALGPSVWCDGVETLRACAQAAAGAGSTGLGGLARRAVRAAAAALLSRGGCQHRWHSLVNCNHCDSIMRRTDPGGTETYGSVSQS